MRKSNSVGSIPNPQPPSAWTPVFGKNTGSAILPALFKPPDSIALDDPSENSVAFPPTPPDSLHSRPATLLVQAALIAAVCHGRRTILLAPELQPVLPTLDSARKQHPLSTRLCHPPGDCVTLDPLRHPTRHSPTRRSTISAFKMGKLIRLELFSTFSPRLEHLRGSCH